MQPLPSSPHRPAFDRWLSLTLDCIIVALERTADPARRAWLRWFKALVEHDIPSFGGKRGVQ
jgi:hypothetical protein